MKKKLVLLWFEFLHSNLSRPQDTSNLLGWNFGILETLVLSIVSLSIGLISNLI